MSRQFDEQIIRQYLLGQLSGEALPELEQKLLIDDQAFEELLAAEADLTDEYLSGALTERERERFEQHCLATPEGQQNLRFARALKNHIAKATASEETGSGSFLTHFWSSQHWGLQTALAFAVIVIIVGAIWFLPPRTSAPQTFQALALNISPDNNRAAGVQAAKVKLNADNLQLTLKLPDGSVPGMRYRALLDNLDNEKAEPRVLQLVGQDAQSVSAVVPAKQLARGRYALKLFAIKSDGSEQRLTGAYYFNVE